MEETARVLSRLEEPNLLIIETCIATGARISEVLGLTWKHVNLDVGTIKIAQRVWHQDIGRQKSECSKRVLGIGDLVDRYHRRRSKIVSPSDGFVFQQKRAPGKPLWDSGVRDALIKLRKQRAATSQVGAALVRRGTFTWRQEVGGSAIEASKIAGHSDLEMTGEYTFVTRAAKPLTRRIQRDSASSRRHQVSCLPLEQQTARLSREQPAVSGFRYGTNVQLVMT